ncbi:MAG: exosortase/archaeosortase family protein [Candidatus Didemnitutus sp.]|nr:exosortase/archaeosortase family protein [Candidatus Didemnitutus sp.]
METAPAPAKSPALPWHKQVPTSFLAALGLSGAFVAFVAFDQMYWWESKEDYSFGWLVPLFTAYAVYDRWPQIVARLREAGDGPSGSRGVRLTLNTLAALALACGALLFLLGAFYRAGAGASQPGTFALTLGMVGIVLPLLFFNAPGGAAGAGSAQGFRLSDLWNEPRARVAVLFLFPVLIWLISAPLVSAIESRVSLFLLRKVVTVVAFSFDLLGYPLEQQGNVLMLPKGPVGVADACSGIRSLTACLFAGSFLGAMFLDRLWKKVFLVAAAMFFAFVMNLGRSLFLTGWAYAYGPEAISGTVHDVAGYAVLGLTCVGLLALVPLLNLRLEHAHEEAAPESETPSEEPRS